MEFQVSFHLNQSIYLRDPESTEIGRHIVKSAIDLIYKLGFEHFTFKKLAVEIHTTEATIYRYFENKHRLLLYILNWYWSYMEFLVVFRLQNVTDKKVKLKTITDLLTHDLPESSGRLDYSKKFLNDIVIAESSKVYLVKEVSEFNKNEVFKPYKDLCAQIAEVIKEYKPDYDYPHSLSSTLIETAHSQQFFCNFLPKLTDVKSQNKSEYTSDFLTSLLFKVLN
ncbi:TetR/AcrR family transcriptional regulator [Dyadobacter sp. CY312]|uniref:TetR/AcrR family transcriptional regulator n=1 Tax=Dyadobacter sp. CY312 TaxID=2907303 RepID=UPI001F40A7B2|nr:TetR/AcrR family transcriptional regulator [Dyadobacter sp. CY312]MCE7038846.1 TetR/AcrR family transcriptional regulator [Dyadobacter sp. CY312]